MDTVPVSLCNCRARQGPLGVFPLRPSHLSLLRTCNLTVEHPTKWTFHGQRCHVKARRDRGALRREDCTI